MIRSIINKLFPGKNSDIRKIIAAASIAPRYEPAVLSFRELKLHVTDQLSVAYQLKEYFADDRMAFLSSTTSPVIIDCGSNVGVSVIYYKKKFPGAIITAIEPDPTIYKCLAVNLSQNNIT